jgi:phasin family protein
MSSITEQFSAATKSQLEAQFQIFSALASAAVDSAEKVIALNINTTKSSVEKTSAAAKKLLGAKDPKEFLTLSTAEHASFESLLSYGRELYSIASAAQNELLRSAKDSFKQVSDLAAAKAGALSKAAPPALVAAVSAAVSAVEKPLAPPQPAAAPIKVQAEDSAIAVKAEVKPSFPAPPPKPIALAPEAKPAKPPRKAAAPKQADVAAKAKK